MTVDVRACAEEYNRRVAERARERERALVRPVRRLKRWFDGDRSAQGFSERPRQES